MSSSRSSNPEFFLAHYDTEGDPSKTVSMPPGPTGMHPWLDLTARLSRAPVVSIASLRGRTRGAGSEFALACDIRLAGDKAILAQFEVGTGVVPGGGPMARLPRLIGRGRALEVLLVADDIDAALAERYGYVNRVVPDDQLEEETDRVARRLASFDKQAIAETKAFVDATTLPDDEELPPALARSSPRRSRPARPRRGLRPWSRTASAATASWSAGWASWSRSAAQVPRARTSDLTGATGVLRGHAAGNPIEEVTMSSTQQSADIATDAPGAAVVEMRFEVTVLAVADVDRAKAFYQGLGWRLDADFPIDEGFRIVQFTPPGSPASIQFGTGLTTMTPGSVKGMYLIVDDIEAARDALISRGADVSEVWHGRGLGTGGHEPGPDPERRSYSSFASFSDPDGNSWLLQELTERLPGRE